VLLGRYEGLRSPLAHDEGVAYLNVELAAGETWRYTPPAGHRVAWAYPYRGRLRAGPEALDRRLAVFETSDQPIEFTAESPSAFVLGSAVPHGHRLVLGPYSVHTSPEALALGQQGIRRAGAQLRQR
jgi:redox-sensitive bicupin YhaK (pirin superfamily)